MMGDVVHVGSGPPHLHVRVVGTAPIERVEVRNGLETIKSFRPYGAQELGRRVKVVWSGAEVRGRARLATWDGSLCVRGNAIRQVWPINFWNPDQQPEHFEDRAPRSVWAWRSVTTGGLSGLILTLAEPYAGSIKVATVQGQFECEISDIGLEPKTWDCGGLRKRIDLYRLADQPPSSGLSFDLALDPLHKGDNPIYVHVVQEDGHMAWSSPVYLVK
jgi:hypothetical protein